MIVPLEREYEVKKDDSLAFREDDEFDRATALTLEAIRAVSEDDLLRLSERGEALARP